MNRWWDDFDKASDIAVRLNNKDDPEMAVGTALLVLHTIGKAAYDAAAHSLDPTNGFLDAPHVISDEALVGAVCKAFDDASGIPGYGATRVAFIKGEADAGARTLAASLRQEQMPWPLVCKHVGETYGLPSSRVVPIRKAMGNSHELITGLAADRALLKWAASIAKAEVQFSKAEKDTFTVKGKERTVHRNEKGEFVSPGSKTAAYMEEKKRQKAKQPKRKKEQVREQEQEEKKESPDWGRSAEVKTKQEKEAERKAELEMRSERAARGSHGEAAFQERIAEQRASIAEQARAGYQAALGFEARRAAIQEAARQGIGQYQGRGKQQGEAKQQQIKQRGKGQQQARAQQQRPEKQKLERLLLFDKENPEATATTVHMTVGGYPISVKAPGMYAIPQSDEDVLSDLDSTFSLYAGVPTESLRDEEENRPGKLLNRFETTKNWVDLFDQDSNEAGLAILNESPDNLPVWFDANVMGLQDSLMRSFDSLPDPKTSEFTTPFKSFSEGKEDVYRGDIAQEYAEEIVDIIRQRVNTKPMNHKELLETMYDHADDKDSVAALVRALQIHEMTASENDFVPATNYVFGPKDFKVKLSFNSLDENGLDTDAELELHDNTMSDWADEVTNFLMSRAIMDATENLIQNFQIEIHPHEPTEDRPMGVQVNTSKDTGDGFNQSQVLSIDLPGNGPVVPIMPTSATLGSDVDDIRQIRSDDEKDVSLESSTTLDKVLDALRSKFGSLGEE